MRPIQPPVRAMPPDRGRRDTDPMPGDVAIWRLDDPQNPGSLRLIAYSNITVDAKRGSLEEAGTVGQTNAEALLGLGSAGILQRLAEVAWTGVPMPLLRLDSVHPSTPETERGIKAFSLGNGYVISLVSDFFGQNELDEWMRRAQRSEILTDVGSGLAHDFNNLLMLIVSCAERLLGAESIDNGVRTEIRTIHQAAMHGAAFAKRLVALGRRETPRSEPVDLGEAFGGIKEILPALLGANIELVTIVGSPGAHVLADPIELEQVLLNLLINARDAMPEGGRVEVATSTVTVAKRLFCIHGRLDPGEYLLLQVEDSGTGMSPEGIEHAFRSRFTTKGEHGSGLGLATVLAIVQRRGGQLRVRTELGRGTCFEIYLPLVPAFHG